MRKQKIETFAWLLFASTCLAQVKKKLPAMQVIPELAKLLAGTALPFKIINDSIAVIHYEGKNIASYQVLVQKTDDLYIIYSNLSEALPGKLNETKFKYLLQRNNHFDIIKIGLAEDETFYVRADLYKVASTAPILKRIISQVANVTNLIGGDLK